MFFSDNICIFCHKKKKTHKHWCDQTQIMIALIVLQYKFASGNIHTSDLRNTLLHKSIGFSQSRVTKTIKLLKIGDVNSCTYCYGDPRCENYDCDISGKHTHSAKCTHLCVACDLKTCRPKHSYITVKTDPSDPRREYIWISQKGLSTLTYWESIYIAANKKQALSAKINTITT